MEYVLIVTVVLILSVLSYRFFILKEFYVTSQYKTAQSYPKTTNFTPLLFKSLREAKFTNIHQTGNQFVAHANATMSSWSEVITINYLERDGEAIIEVESKCAVPTQIFDWGKNRRNVKRFFMILEQNLGKAVPEPDFLPLTS